MARRGAVLRRLLVAVPSVFVIVFVVFALNRAFVADFYTRFKQNPQVSREILERQRRDAGLDRPLFVQYLYWLRGVLFDVRFRSPRSPLPGAETPPSGAIAPGAAAIAFPATPAWTGDAHDAIEIEVASLAGDAEVEARAGGAVARARVPGGGAAATLSLPFEAIGPRDSVARIDILVAGSPVRLARLDLVERGLGFSLGWPNLGVSFEYQLPVTTVLAPALLRSFLLISLAFLVTWLVAIPAGVYCAVHRNSFGDRFFSFLTLGGMAVPSFFVAILALTAVSLTAELPEGNPFRNVLPVGGLTSENFGGLSFPGKLLDLARHLAVPVVVIALEGMASLQRVMRGSLLDELRAQYVVTARAKGLPESRVVYRHALRNAINPLVSHLGTLFPALVGGSALVEMVCAYPGMGGVLLKAIRDNDLYVVLGANLMAGLLLVAGNLFSDFLLQAVDPRVEAA